ncbi:ThiF family adenylyltransferase [Actinocrispum wychmicini]|uniref:ThiF family protein n=1 Tax=Actinocrispum wychmicini TaxID=1213861 RepID=A0A4R2JDM5_9PSEU|nr:ThiF family adenylyltransferase [Actinocrispum wychmicini]TCO54299.1 ThiF family protein [Actinocrispum wychmicini]
MIVDLDGLRAAVDQPVTWRPVLVRLATGQRAGLKELCRRHGIAVLDTIERQLAELARVRFPSDKQVEDRRRFVADVGSANYGVWVYFPWADTIAHVLAPDDYFDVITSRNRDKITHGEQRALRDKCVGVVGLSVGGEAAVTLAQETLCGHLKLADFDLLDLSNLNRLNAGVTDLGVPKAWIAVRRIATINPFLRLTVVDEAVTTTNAAEFLDGLDLLVEECDGLQVKYDIRQLARKRGIDVIYAADERGFLSVEPYRTHPDLDVFHGEHPGDLVQWLGGWDNLSERARRSVGQIGISLGGYPQLAGEARYAAAQLANVARRLLLGERIAPTHRHFDLEDLIPGE